MFGLDKLVGVVVDTITSPVKYSIDVLEGLSEGEIRTKAALHLGADVVAGMTLSEVVEYLLEVDV